MAFRPVTTDDLSLMIRIEAECFGGERFSDEDLMRLIDRDDVHLQLLLDPEPVGSFGVMLLDEEGWIITLAVLPECRGAGHAHAMMDEALNICRKAGCEQIILQVETINVAAANLYLRYGFRVAGLIPDYYGPGRDAFHMVLGP